MEEHERAAASMFAEVHSEVDVEAVHAYSNADAAVVQATTTQRVVQRAVPAGTLVSTGLFLTGTPVGAVVGRVAVSAGAGTLAMQYLLTARRARALGKLEADFAREGRHEVALHVCSARVRLLAMLPGSRTRTIAAMVRGLHYAAGAHNTDAMRSIGEALDESIAALPKGPTKRLLAVADEVGAQLVEHDDPGMRGSARALLIHVFRETPFSTAAAVALDAAVDYNAIAEGIFAGVVGGDAGAFGEFVTIGVDEDAEHDVLDLLIGQAQTLLAAGFADVIGGADRATGDAWARKALRIEALPKPLVLRAYADAMEMTDDDRLEAFRESIEDPDPEKVEALRMLGAEPTTRDDLGR